MLRGTLPAEPPSSASPPTVAMNADGIACMNETKTGAKTPITIARTPKVSAAMY